MERRHGVQLTYGYVHGRIASVAVNGNALLTEVLYEPFGPIRQWTWSNATSAVRTFDADGNLLQVDSGGDFYSYAYDDAFRITGITNASSPALSWTYGYDSRDQLTSGTSPVRNESWTYDANGNRLTQSATVPSTISNTLAISASSNRVTSIAGSHANTYGYDGSGNVTSESDAGRPVAGPGTTVYLYNALSQRIRKSQGSASVNFVYDEAGHLLGEYSGTGALIQETVWLGDIPVATLRPRVGGGVDVYYVHTDHLNAPRKITRASDNAILWRWDPGAFGDTLPNENPENAGTFAYNLRFPGQYYDAESGLHYNYFRDYDPGTGRYQESDPIGLVAGINTYAYTNNSPLDSIDAPGLAGERGGGRKSLGGNDPLIPQNITKNTPKAEVDKAVKALEETIKKMPNINPARKKALEAWMKVAKRGFTKSLSCPPLLEDLVKGTLREMCGMGDVQSCKTYRDFFPDDFAEDFFVRGGA